MKSRFCDNDVALIKKLGFVGVAQDILETIGDGFCAIDSDWRIVYVNIRACEMCGSASDSLIGRVFWKVFPEITGTDAEERLRGAIKAGAVKGCAGDGGTGGIGRVQLRKKDSTRCAGLAATHLLPHRQDFDKGLLSSAEVELGKLMGISNAVAVYRHRILRGWQESEERFRQVFQQSSLGMAIADRDGRFREVNPALSRMLGYAAEDLTRLSYLDIVYPDDREVRARQGRAAAAGEISHFQLVERLVRRSGEPIWVSINVSPVRGQDGQVLYTLSIIESIEERRRGEEALQQANELLEQRIDERTRQLSASQARLQAHFNNSPDWLTLFRAREDGAFVYEDLNPATERAYGLMRDQIIGRRLEEVLGVEPASCHSAICVPA